MNLTQNARGLSERWHATKLHWRDAKALDFEKQYLDPLPAMVSKASIMMNELETLIKKIRKDCEQTY
jgi:hypothetical protein